MQAWPIGNCIALFLVTIIVNNENLYLFINANANCIKAATE